ncbi:MAG: PAS domain S-box protein [Bacteroidia bacterium]|nr:PAS domain S-box protein [Bacteroidia bacterium]
MAREMAVVLAAMRPEKRSDRILLERWVLILILVALGIGILGWVGFFWAVPDWRGAVLGTLWGVVVAGGAYSLWRFWDGVRRYKETVQYQAREEVLRIEGRYKALVQYASDVFLILGREGSIVYASPSVQRALGYLPSQVEGAPIRDYLHSEDRPLVESALTRQSSAFFTARFQHREGYWHYFEAIGQPLFSDPIIQGYLLTVRDVTDRKREEEQRREKEAAALRLAVERERAEYEKNLIEQSKRELEEAYRIIERKNYEIEQSFQYAARIQQGMVVSVQHIREYLPESFVFWKPRDVVSGDFYWFFPMEDRVYFAVADCTGHGVPGALMTMISSAMLSQAVLGEELREPDEILSTVHRLMRRALRQDVPGSHSEDGMDIALVYYELGSRRLHYAGANRSLWIARPGDTALLELKADRKGIGGASAPPAQFFTLHVVDLPEHTWVYMASDGFADQFGGKDGRKYMGRRLKGFLYQLSSLSAEAQAQALEVELENWRGSYPQVDDILIAGFRS